MPNSIPKIPSVSTTATTTVTSTGNDSGIPAMPTAQVYNSVKNIGGATAGFALPIVSLTNTGKTAIQLNVDFDNTAADQIFLLNGVSQYAISIADINTALTLSLTKNTSFIWYDNVDLAVYQLYQDASNNLFLIKITNAGTITNIGSDSPANYGFTVVMTSNTAVQIMTRAAQGSGDFTVTYCEEAEAGVRETVTVSSSTGLASGNIPFILSGAVLTPAGGVTYITADGTAAIGQMGRLSVISGNVKTTLPFLRADGYGAIDPGRSHSYFFDGNNATFPRYMLWDDIVVISQGVENTVSNVTILGPRCYPRNTFDAWVQSVCTFLGLPS